MPGKSHRWRSLVGYSPWGCEESDTTKRLHFHALEKEMATHSSVLAWRIPGTVEPGGLPSMGLHRVGDSAAAAAAAMCNIRWTRNTFYIPYLTGSSSNSMRYIREYLLYRIKKKLNLILQWYLQSAIMTPILKCCMLSSASMAQHFFFFFFLELVSFQSPL